MHGFAFQTMIYYQKHEAIDKEKWDACISNSLNGRFYVLSWFLDLIAPGWNALICDDYQAVMPLTMKRKYGLPVWLQPSFLKFTDVYSSGETEYQEWVPILWNYLRKNLFFSVNFSSNLVYDAMPYSTNNIKAQELNIRKSYDEVRSNYQHNIIKNLKKSEKAPLSFHEVKEYQHFESLKMLNYRHKTTTYGLKILKHLILQNNSNIRSRLFGIKNEDDQYIIVSSMVEFKNRVYFISSGATHEARQKKAKFMLYDQIIKKYAGAGYHIDFMGSHIPGVAYFNKGFGATDYNYVHLKGGILHQVDKLIKQ